MLVTTARSASLSVCIAVVLLLPISCQLQVLATRASVTFAIVNEYGRLVKSRITMCRSKHRGEIRFASTDSEIHMLDVVLGDTITVNYSTDGVANTTFEPSSFVIQSPQEMIFVSRSSAVLDFKSSWKGRVLSIRLPEKLCASADDLVWVEFKKIGSALVERTVRAQACTAVPGRLDMASYVMTVYNKRGLAGVGTSTLHQGIQGELRPRFTVIGD